jgi:hypothetical protein
MAFTEGFSSWERVRQLSTRINWDEQLTEFTNSGSAVVTVYRRKGL